jgi:molybdopterin/thiamine biosynthesis adenylyltransferase
MNEMAEDERFLRQIKIISPSCQRKLASSKLFVAGLGGVGGICAELLIRAGIGKMMVMDFDKFELSNINRQIHAQGQSIGKMKIDVFENKAKSINPKSKILKFGKKLQLESLGLLGRKLYSFSPHIVIDSMDVVSPRVLLWRLCKKRKIPYVYAASAYSRGMISVLCGSIDLEEMLHLPSKRLPEQQIEPSLIHYPQCNVAWGPATNLVGVLAANAALNYLLKKPCPIAPKCWMVDTFSKKIFWEEKLS